MLCYVMLCYVMLCSVLTTVNSLTRQSWILNSTPWNPDHQILDSRFPVSVEVGFKIPIVSGIPDFLSCIPDSTNKQKFPGFWKLY